MGTPSCATDSCATADRVTHCDEPGSHDVDDRDDGNSQGRLVIYLIRHAQSEFNAMHDDDGNLLGPQTGHDLAFDAGLTAEGRRQVAALRRAMLAGEVLNRPPPDVVLTSPLTRALQTAVRCFGGTEDDDGDEDDDDDDDRDGRRNTEATSQSATESTGSGRGSRWRIVADPDLREHLTDSCDVGSSPRTLRRRFASWESVDLSQLSTDVWWYSNPERPATSSQEARKIFTEYGCVEPEEELELRTDSVVTKLRQRTEKCVALVGHADMFNLLAKRLASKRDAGEDLWLQNCEVRRFVLERT